MKDRLLLIHEPEASNINIVAFASESGHPPIRLDQIQEPALREFCAKDSRCIVLQLHGDDGFSNLIQSFREIPQSHRPYTIVLCDSHDPERQQRYLAAGADDLIISPVDEAQLQSRLHPAKRFLQLQREFRHQSLNDPLTGALNRGAVLDYLDREIKRSNRFAYPVAVVMADVDLLKTINDTQGHLAGDAAMAAVASRIASQLRPYDAVGRYGGDEFLIILSNCNATLAMEVCERIRHAVSDKVITTPTLTCKTTISMGVAATEAKGVTPPQTLILLADNALYEAKRTGRDRVMASP